MNMNTTALAHNVAPAPAPGTTTTPSLPISLDELMDDCRRMVVVAAHPGDEALAMGGAIAMWLQQGGALMIIVVTDGDAPPPAPDCWWTPARLRCIRPAESSLALHHLGWPQTATMKRLHVPQGRIADHEQRLARYLQQWLRPDDRILTAWRHDGFDDSAATSRAAASAANAAGCTAVEFPIWNRTRALLDQDATSRQLRHLDIETKAFWRKRKALTVFRSQLDADPVSGAPPRLPEHVLGPCLQAVELLWL